MLQEMWSSMGVLVFPLKYDTTRAVVWLGEGGGADLSTEVLCYQNGLPVEVWSYFCYQLFLLFFGLE